MMHQRKKAVTPLSDKRALVAETQHERQQPADILLIPGRTTHNQHLILQMQGMIGNAATVRWLNRSLIQRAPEDDDATASTDTTSSTSDSAAADETMPDVSAQISELFDQYDKLEVQVPLEDGSQATINVHLAYFINTYKESQINALKALREKEASGAELDAKEQKALGNLIKREKRYNLHMQVKSALKRPIQDVYGKAEMKRIIGKYKGGKGPPEYYQKLIQVAINEAAEAGKKKKGLPEPGKTKDEWQTNVQEWVNEHHVGVDCSGMVDHMMETVAASHNETYDKWDKDNPVATVADLQAGDVFNKPKEGNEVGHVRVVQNVEVETEELDGGVTKQWLVVTLVESASSTKGANVRRIRFPYDNTGLSMADAVQKMQEDLGSGWKNAKGERKKYTAYRRTAPATAE